MLRKGSDAIAFSFSAEDEIKRKLFPYAKIECARFKGEEPGNFIDRKSFQSSILTQPEEAYQFVIRHISQGTTDYTGVYRNDRWEYPVIAIREAIREHSEPKYKLITNHTARKTFITNSIMLGMNTKTIKEITGHKKDSVFNKYVKISEEFKKLEMERTWDSIPMEGKKSGKSQKRKTKE